MLVNDNYKQLDTVSVDDGRLIPNPEHQRQGQFYTMQPDATAGEINNQADRELEKQDVPGNDLDKELDSKETDSKEARRAARMNQPDLDVDTTTLEYNELQQQLENPDRTYNI